ncbi:MAG: Rieske 2Fe-2S domain-containing protein [Candidatus Rokubacteria bacterium]|nr:Rieske 2Fe-2S domain-containing protein [Candidatus Rokubacteria bacterium]
MLSAEENDLLCRVGSVTPMGALLRQYWVPALLSSELPEPDGAPVRVRLLGEHLIGFRTTSGTVALIQNHCPHRGASLFFGRNEEDGLRCVYHGWKFDVTGRCVDMPSEPAESSFKDKVRAVTYPCVERNDVVWAYMGPRTPPPPLPDLEPNMIGGEIVVQKVLRECNWAQGLEGDIDTSHLGFLHLGSVKPEDIGSKTFDYYTVKERAPKYEVVDTELGTSYGAYRPAEEDIASIHKSGPAYEEVWKRLVQPEKDRDPDKKGYAVLIKVERAEDLDGEPLKLG